jgi:signal transduction histidine kinase
VEKRASAAAGYDPAAMAKPTTGTAQLKPRARILRTFGDELISSETVAVIELVKNSYDADATRVLVRFTGPLEVGKGSIDVVDDGHGMSTDTVTSVWMEPATRFRASERRSEERDRRVLGEKGIGRFAASRLADRLMLATRREDAEFETTALFDWSQFDDEDSYLSDVEVLWEETEPQELTKDGMLGRLPGGADDGDSGTLLHMEGLRTDWDREKVTTLHSALSRLISPFAGTDGDGPEDFRISLELPAELADLSGEIGPVEALQNPEYVLRGQVDEDGGYEFTRRIGRDGEEEVIRGVLKPGDRSRPSCGPLGLELRVWDRDPGALRSVAEEAGLGVRDFRRELDEFSGVSIYRDGFRVFPYGERGNDWLGLDLRRVNLPTRRISNNQIAGYVSISHEDNPELVDQTNREGLMQNRSYDDLRDIVLGALQEIEGPRQLFRKAARQPEKGDGAAPAAPTDPLETFNLEDLRDTVREKTGGDPEIEGAFEEQQKAFEAGTEEVRDLIGGYQRLASLGRLVDAILHDGRAPLGSIDSDALIGMREIKAAKRKDDPVTELAAEKFSAIRDQASVLDALFKRIVPFAGRKRRRRKKVVLEDLVRETFELERARTDELGVQLELPQTSTEATVEETDIRIILYNLFDNALHWLKDVDEDERTIAVKVSRKTEDDAVEILFSDSGPGVSEEDANQIFEPYFSRKVSGWGIGLSQASSLISEHYDGSMGLLKKGPLPGANFRILLRRGA